MAGGCYSFTSKHLYRTRINCEGNEQENIFVIEFFLEHFMPLKKTRFFLMLSLCVLAGLSCRSVPPVDGQLHSVWADITSFGAAPDGRSLNTVAIQAAIDTSAKAGGGTVYFPPGTYLSGTLHLRDNVRLYLDSGAVLLGSRNAKDYKPGHLIMAQDVNNIGIAGNGCIDGQAHAFWEKKPYEDYRGFRTTYGWVPSFAYRHPKKAPGHLIQFTGCSQIVIKDVLLKNAEKFTLYLVGCTDINISGVTVRNYLHGPNADGIDLGACSNVTISDCDIYTADDVICLKNEVPEYKHMACRDITVNNCILTTTCNGFKIGTGTQGDFENIVFSNSIIKGGKESEELARISAPLVDPNHHGNALAPLSGIAVETVDGGNVRGVSVSNIVMEQVRAPIFIRLGNRGRGTKKGEEPLPGTLRDVSISNITAYGASTPSSITGLPGHPVEDITIENIRITTCGGGTEELAEKKLEELPGDYPEAVMWGPMPAYGLYCRHARRLNLRDIRIFTDSPDARALLICDDVTDLNMRGLQVNEEIHSKKLIRLNNVRHIVVTDINPPPGRYTWIYITDPGSRDILIVPNDLTGVVFPLELGEGVHPDEVRMIRL